MAFLTVTTTASCTGTQGYINLTSLVDPTGQSDGDYTWKVVRADGTDFGGPVSIGDTLAVPDANYAVRVYATYGSGLKASSSQSSFTVACASGTTGPGPALPPDPPGPTGCTTPRALNYDPAATQDSAPTACVFVQVTAKPADLVAAHLPIPVVVRASPTAAGLATIVVLHLDTAAATAGPWVEFASLRQVCDATATAHFNLSEAAKSLLRILPPVVDGVDPALSALLRVRYEVRDPATQALSYSGTVGTCRALNATVAPVAGAALTTPTVYETLPAGGAQWETTATLAGGVVNTLLDLPASGCPARQFVWLNPAGAWDTGFFFGHHGHGTDQADPLTVRDAAGADRYARRGTVRDTLQVYSDKLSYATFLALRGLRNSVQVYERTGPGQYVPVLVASESYSEFQEVTDKTFQVNFTVSYPAQLIQTQ